MWWLKPPVLLSFGGGDYQDDYQPKNRQLKPSRLRGQAHIDEKKVIQKVINKYKPPLNKAQQAELKQAIEDAKHGESRGNDDNLNYEEILELAIELFGLPPG